MGYNNASQGEIEMVKNNDLLKNEEKDKDKLIEELMNDNKRLYKRGILVVIMSFILGVMGTHYGYKEAKKDIEKQKFLDYLKIYNFLQDEIDEKLDYQLRGLLTQFNDYEYYLMNNTEVIDNEEAAEDIKEDIDKCFSFFQNNLNSEDNLTAKEANKSKIYEKKI